MYETRMVRVGDLTLGGHNPVWVQSMTNTDTRDAQATLGQIRALAKAGLHADPRLYGEVAYAGYRQHVCDTLDRILATVPDTDGFFFTTHILATEALRYFHDRGIDISDGRRGLACMHEDPLFRLAAPRMSVARFPVEEISAHAVRLLLRQIRESQSPGSVRPAPESVVLPCRMEFRDE